MKRIISLILSLVIVLSICISAPVSLVAFASDSISDDDPIKNVEWVKKPDKTEYMQGEGPSLVGGIIRITGADGSVQDITLDLHHAYYRTPYFVEMSGHQIRFDEGIENWCNKTVGEYTNVLSIGGHELTFDYTVTEFNVTDITIQLDEYKNLDIILHKSDGTSSLLNYLAEKSYRGTDTVHFGSIITDKGGSFGGEVHLGDNGEFSIVYYGESGNISSNTILAKEEFNMFNFADWLVAVVSTMYGSTKNFNAKINENNIYDIARIALYNLRYDVPFHLEYWSDVNSSYNNFSYDGDVETAENAIYNTFGIKVDLTDYSIYDKKTKKVKIENEVNRKAIKFPITKKWIDGLWYITAESNGEIIEIVVDENRTIKSFKIGEGCAHKSSVWLTDQNATVYKAGSKHKECTECGEVLKTATIAQLKCSKPKLSKIENTPDGVKITWGKVSGADSYAVYRKTGSSGKYSKIATVKGNSKVTYTDKSAKSGKKYYYLVKALNEAGSSDSSSSKSIYHLADTTLSTPKSTKSGITLKWKKVTGADGYMVYRKTGSGSYSKIATVKGNSKVTYTDKKAKKGKTYTYKIKAYKSKTYSAYSNAKKIKDKY